MIKPRRDEKVISPGLLMGNTAAAALPRLCSFRAKAPSALHPPQGALDFAALKGQAFSCFLTEIVRAGQPCLPLEGKVARRSRDG